MILRRICDSFSTITRRLTSPPPPPKPSRLLSSSSPPPNPIPKPKSPIGSPSRVQKLIASQSDPLLAKEIFDYASKQPNFRHSQSSHLIVIHKLVQSKHSNLIDDVLRKQNPLTGETFNHLIKLYNQTNSPQKALNTFQQILKFNLTPTPKHLNLILQALVNHRGYLQKGFDLFKHSVVTPNTKSYNILMKAFVDNNDLSIAYQLFGKMLERDVVPDVDSYKILIQGFCRKGQVNRAMELLDDMLNKGFVPDRLSYTTLLNSLCRKVQVREAYKVLCRMKLKGVNPDIVHYNTTILGFVRENRGMDARKVIDDMVVNGCEPDLVSYRTLICGLCDQGMFDEGKKYLEEMVSKGFSVHFSVSNHLVKGFCGFGKVDDACDVVEVVLKNNGGVLHLETWEMIVSVVCRVDESVKIEKFIEDAVKVEVSGDTRIVDAGGIGFGLGGYLSSKKAMKRKNVVERRRHFI